QTALHDGLMCGGGCSSYIGALNEAVADYYAVASFRMHPTVIGSQVGTGLEGTVRDLNNDFRFPCDLTGESHEDGRIWAGFLREVRTIVGRQADAQIFQSLRL